GIGRRTSTPVCLGSPSPLLRRAKCGCEFFSQCLLRSRSLASPAVSSNSPPAGPAPQLKQKRTGTAHGSAPSITLFPRVTPPPRQLSLLPCFSNEKRSAPRFS